MELRDLLAFGSGAGIEIRGSDLELVVARVRPHGVTVTARAIIQNFRERPAAEWGMEYTAFLKSAGAAHLSATVLLPRAAVLVRQIALPGVSARDLPAAIELQLDALHPYGDDEVAWGWSPLAQGGALVGMARRDVLERYAGLFAEAGIAVASFTFSAAALHAALRLLGAPPAAAFFTFARSGEDAVEIYGESPAHPVFSAEFELPPDRAAALAAAELRLEPGAEPAPLDKLLPAPLANPVENDLSRNALPYAAALAGACPRLAPSANLLPPERRASHSRAVFIPTAVLAALLLAVTGAILAHSAMEDRRYLGKIEEEIARLEPEARKAAALDREIDRTRARTRLLDEFRSRTRDDLDALNELTRLMPPPIWTNNIELTRDAATVNGEAEQAAALLKVLDASPLFQNSEFSVIARNASNELFRIRTNREARK